MDEISKKCQKSIAMAYKMIKWPSLTDSQKIQDVDFSKIIPTVFFWIRTDTC